MARSTGTYSRATAGGEEVAAFVPHPLPPVDPPLSISGEIEAVLGAAGRELALLELAGAMVPSIDWFLYGFVRKEAVVSSQIEGTQATLVDVLGFEATDRVDPERAGDVEEVCNYVAALKWARAELRRAKGLPLSVRLLNGTHTRLMKGVRGATKAPGQLRRTQNWIGGTRPGNAVFVPPPPQVVPDLLGALERWLHADDALPPLVRIGLAHVQFETIHPYLDGNGRIGRLLITLLLEHWGLLSSPMLYLSLYFKRHRSQYYERLDAVRRHGDWEGWTRYFLDGVATIAAESVASARDLHALVIRDRSRLLDTAGTTVAAIKLFEKLPEHPVLTIAWVTQALHTTKPTAAKAVTALTEAGILRETTGKPRDRTFVYRAYLDRLREGTEL
jgi:Fic family protein